MEQAQYNPIPNKIPTLEYDYSYVNVLGGNAQFINNVVNSEVERNIMKEGEKPLGTLEVKCEKFHLKSGLLFPILSGGTLFIGNLLGMPFSTGKIDLEATSSGHTIIRKQGKAPSGFITEKMSRSRP